MALGIFLAVANGIARLAGDIYENHSNEQAKDWTRKNYPDSPTYMDCYGRTKLISNNHPTLEKTLPNGDNVLIDTKTWKQVYNYSEARRQKESAGMTDQQIKWRNKAIAEGKRFYLFKIPKHPEPWIYQDLKTGKLCYHKTFHGAEYYVDFNDNLLAFDNNISECNMHYAEDVKKDPSIGVIIH